MRSSRSATAGSVMPARQGGEPIRVSEVSFAPEGRPPGAGVRTGTEDLFGFYQNHFAVGDLRRMKGIGLIAKPLSVPINRCTGPGATAGTVTASSLAFA
jgi:hypothetical protein